MFSEGQLVQFAADICSHTAAMNVMTPADGLGVVMQVGGDGDPQISMLSAVGVASLMRDVGCDWFLRQKLVGKVQVWRLDTDVAVWRRWVGAPGVALRSCGGAGDIDCSLSVSFLCQKCVCVGPPRLDVAGLCLFSFFGFERTSLHAIVLSGKTR